MDEKREVDRGDEGRADPVPRLLMVHKQALQELLLLVPGRMAAQSLFDARSDGRDGGLTPFRPPHLVRNGIHGGVDFPRVWLNAQIAASRPARATCRPSAAA